MSRARQAGAVTQASGGFDDSRACSRGRDEPVDDLEPALDALMLWRGAGGGVTVVAIDGHGASGKSTIAEILAEMTGASVLHTDDFFVPSGRQGPGAGSTGPDRDYGVPSGERWPSLGSYFDLVRLRAEALEPLRAGRAAVFRAFDWDLGRVSGEPSLVEPNDLVLLEGVYSSAPELGRLIDRAIYIDTAEPERLRRLGERVAPEDWDEQWLQAEKEYFARARRIESFDLVIPGHRVAAASSSAGSGPRQSGVGSETRGQ